MRAAIGIFLLAFFALPAWAGPQEAVRRVYADGDLQREHPHGRVAEEPARPPTRERRSSTSSGAKAAGAVAETLVWVLAIAVLAVALVWVIRAWGGRRSIVATPDVAPVVGGAAPAALAGPRAHAEALAEQGRYAEAVHVLLLETLDVLSQRSRLLDAWTSREILGAVTLEDDARTELGRLVDATEITLFGGRPADEEAYRTCLESHGRFAALLAGAPS